MSRIDGLGSMHGSMVGSDTYAADAKLKAALDRAAAAEATAATLRAKVDGLRVVLAKAANYLEVCLEESPPDT